MTEKEEIAALESQFKDGKLAYSLQEKLLKDRLIVRMKAELFEKFQATGFNEESERTEIWRKMQVVGWFDDLLTQIVNDGKMAEEDLKGFDKIKQFFKGA